MKPEATGNVGLPALTPSGGSTRAGSAQRHAIALTYEASFGAPRVVAKGKGLVAEHIIATAREHGVFVHESRELVSLLMNVDLDQEIPPVLYRVVAELLAWLYQIETEAAQLHGAGK